MQSHNPVMKEGAFQKSAWEAGQAGLVIEKMTVQGAVNKTFILTGLMLVTAVIGFMFPSRLFMWGGAIAGLIVAVIAARSPQKSATLAPIYALIEGLFVGSVSAIYATAFDGIILHAASFTVAILFMMLFLYKTGVIKVTQKFRSIVMIATGAIMLVYLVSFVFSFFSDNVSFLHNGGTMSIVISLVIIGVASLNLLLDFDNFEKGERYGAPQYMEWFSAMGLLITLIWLYVEILRLLSYFMGSD